MKKIKIKILKSIQTPMKPLRISGVKYMSV